METKWKKKMVNWSTIWDQYFLITLKADCDIEVGMSLRVGIFEKLFIMSFSIELLSQLLCDMRDWSNKQTKNHKTTQG